MMRSWTWTCALLAITFACSAVADGGGQLTYARGQNVVAAFDGWERNPDGTFGMVFSYYNRNYSEVLDIPVGPDNSVEPGGPDQGQPTHFLPARHKFVFTVKVPKDWDPAKRLVWTLTSRGKTEKANGFLLPEWEMNNQVRAQNGDGWATTGGNAAEYNESPQITAGRPLRVTLPGSATLTALVKDDGLPKPRVRRAPPVAGISAAAAAGVERSGGGTGAAPNGATAQAAPVGSQLRVNWVMYRGPAGATVTFAPDVSPVADGKAETAARFSRPGQYVVRAYADDGAVTAPADITVTVAPAK
jgi:hypothetical protein